MTKPKQPAEEWEIRFELEFGSRREMMEAGLLHTPQEAANLMILYDRTKTFIASERERVKREMVEKVEGMKTSYIGATGEGYNQALQDVIQAIKEI